MDLVIRHFIILVDSISQIPPNMSTQRLPHECSEMVKLCQHVFCECSSTSSMFICCMFHHAKPGGNMAASLLEVNNGQVVPA